MAATSAARYRRRFPANRRTMVSPSPPRSRRRSPRARSSVTGTRPRGVRMGSYRSRAAGAWPGPGGGTARVRMCHSADALEARYRTRCVGVSERRAKALRPPGLKVHHDHLVRGHLVVAHATGLDDHEAGLAVDATHIPQVSTTRPDRWRARLASATRALRPSQHGGDLPARTAGVTGKSGWSRCWFTPAERVGRRGEQQTQGKVALPRR